MADYPNLIAHGPGMTVRLPGDGQSGKIASAVRTDLIGSIVTYSDVAGNVVDVLGSTQPMQYGRPIPLESIHYKVHGDGNATRVLNYGFGPGSQLLHCPTHLARRSTGWTERLAQTTDSVLVGSSSSGFAFCTQVPQIIKVRYPIHQYLVPFITEAIPSDADSYAGLINNATVTIGQLTCAAYTLRWDGIEYEPIDSLPNVKYRTWLKLTYFSRGWYQGIRACSRWVPDEANKPAGRTFADVYQQFQFFLVLQYNQTTFPNIDTYCGGCPSSSSTG